MFVSRTRSVVYPQFEHARLAGAIAQHWGNEQFCLPELPFHAFCSGVALHDFGYGLLDTHDIVGMGAAERLATFESMMSLRFDDPVVEVVAKMHVARLLSWAGLTELEADCRQALASLVRETGVPLSVFQDADTITSLCDAIAFDFCFEQSKTGSVAVLADGNLNHRIDLHYAMDFRSVGGDDQGDVTGRVRLAPWPLSVGKLNGYLFAYEQSGYPEVLKPRPVTFELLPG